LENELSTLKKQKSLLEKGNQVLISEMKKLKEQLGMQEEAADLLAKSWEKRCKELEEENARLQHGFPSSEVRGGIDEQEETSFESELTAKSVSEAVSNNSYLFKATSKLMTALQYSSLHPARRQLRPCASSLPLSGPSQLARLQAMPSTLPLRSIHQSPRSTSQPVLLSSLQRRQARLDLLTRHLDQL
jgi:hypothetical protein